jgi:glucosamine kinase
MILIADSGSTKTEWCLINEVKDTLFFTTEGYNPYFSSENHIVSSIRSNFPPGFPYAEVKELNFYGSGCHEDKIVMMKQVLGSIFTKAQAINVFSDLLGAARALLGNKPGFAAILGTGTNTCLYDGESIIQNVDSLGYVLGDEGSGTSIGKRILSDYLRDKMPAEVRQQFDETYKLKAGEIIHKIYVEPLANRFCANFTRFLTQLGPEHPYTRRVVSASFNQLFDELISCYPSYETYTFNCVGSVAYHFKDILREVAAQHHMDLGNIQSSLISDLEAYHRSEALSLA